MGQTPSIQLTARLTPSGKSIMSQDDQIQVEKAYREQSGRLRNFIRRFVPGAEDAEDILQDVFYELAGGFSEIRSMDRLTSWLYTVARNRITDRFRKKKPVTFSDRVTLGDDGEPRFLDEVIPSDDSDPIDVVYRGAIVERLEDALDELPENQREVFVLHEIEGRSFKEIEVMTGVGLNTLLSRKRYAVLKLREQLLDLYQELDD